MAKNQILKFEGDIRASTINVATGVKTPVIPDGLDIFGNIPLEASAQIFSYEAGEEVNVVSKRRDRYNQTIYAEVEPGTTGMSLTLVAVPPALLARAFYGEAANVNITGAAVTDEEITFAADALSQPLAHMYLASSPAPVVTNSGGGTTYVAGTDYVIDARLGRIRRVEGGAITAAETVKVSYTYASISLIEIRGGVQPQQALHITGDYKNRPDGADMYLEVYHWNAATDGEVDFFSSEPITVTLAGNCITPEDKTEPYKITMVDTGDSTPPALVASRLAFVTPISGAEALENFGPVQVRVETASGELVTSDNTTSVALTKALGPGDLTVSTPVTAVNGIATFPSVAADDAGDYVLLATAAGLNSAASPTITITA